MPLRSRTSHRHLRTDMVRCKILPHYQLACTHVCTHSLDRSNLFYSTRGLKKEPKVQKETMFDVTAVLHCAMYPYRPVCVYPFKGRFALYGSFFAERSGGTCSSLLRHARDRFSVSVSMDKEKRSTMLAILATE